MSGAPAPAAGAAAGDPDVIDIGTHRQLFLDDLIASGMDGLERVFHPAAKHPRPVVVADRPWEKGAFLGALGNCVFYDDQDRLFRMYYIIYQMIGHSERQHNAYAVSRDGLRWSKPKLGLADYKGSRDNNLLADFEAPRFKQEFWTFNNVFKDPRDPDPARRYKALGFGMRLDGSRAGMIVAFSPDGLRWTEAAENPVLPNGDTHTVLGWDSAVGKYVAYPRTGPGRCIGYSTSDDFVHWSEARTVMEPGPGDPPDYQIYGMPVFKHEGLYIGVPWAFIAAGTEPLDTQIAVSRDGVKWQKVGDGRVFIPRGPAGTFDDCYAIASAPVVVGDELWFYYMGCGFPHGPQFAKENKWEGSIGLARLRMDGFVSLACAMDSGGALLTRPVRFAGRRLLVNCNCPRGWLRVEIQDAEGKPIPGFAEQECAPVHADSVRHEVTWRGGGDVGALAGKPVRLRIRLGDGELFSFGFAE